LRAVLDCAEGMRGSSGYQSRHQSENKTREMPARSKSVVSHRRLLTFKTDEPFEYEADRLHAWWMEHRDD